jgi:hypothetical protein
MALVVSTPTGSKDYGPTKLLLFHLKVRDFSNPDLGKLHNFETKEKRQSVDDKDLGHDPLRK